MKFMNYRERKFDIAAARLMVIGLLAVTVAFGCSLTPKERANPLDPLNPVPPLQLTLELVDTVIDTVSDRKIQLTWSGIEHGGLLDYRVYRRVPINFENFTLLDIVESSLTTFTDFSSCADTAYYYKIVALMGDGTDSIFSEEIRYLGRFDDRY